MKPRLRIEWERRDAPQAELVELFPNATNEWVPIGEITEADMRVMRPDFYVRAVVARISFLRNRRQGRRLEAA